MRIKGAVRVGASVVTAAALLPAAAHGSATVGQAQLGGGTCSPPSPFTYVQSASVSPSYRVPSYGVITSWSYVSGSIVPTALKFKLLRPTGTPGTWSTAGHSTAPAIPPDATATFPARILAQPGDVIGMTMTTTGMPTSCSSFSSGGSTQYFVGDPADGSTSAYTAGSTNLRLDLSAVLEPDVDEDGFGDETQDGCPGDPAAQGACSIADKTPPETSIDKHPAKRIRKRRATLGFSSPDPGASFECSLDGSGFKACASPLITTVSRGKHVFLARAVDAAGNRDASPAKAGWKVKRKRR